MKLIMITILFPVLAFLFHLSFFAVSISVWQLPSTVPSPLYSAHQHLDGFPTWNTLDSPALAPPALQQKGASR